MRDPIIIGSGPAAAAVALALSSSGIRPRVIDIGIHLEPDRQQRADHLGELSPDQWSASEVADISVQPAAGDVHGLPEKRLFGSNFPFRDGGQITNITALQGAHRAVVSGAYGGFSNVWGAQVMPFTQATFATWPISAQEIAPHYTKILHHIPFAGEADDLSTLFPLYRSPARLPELSSRSELVLSRYARHREELNRGGVTMGRARLAVSGAACARCGLCMTGCPYRLIYSASQTFDDLRQRDAIDYLPNLLAVHLQEEAGRATVVARHRHSGALSTFEADRVFVACGGIGSTQLVLGSLGRAGETVKAQESAQFTLPLLSGRSAGDPRQEQDFTLNQFNMVIDADDDGLNVSQIHFYTYNPAFEPALPAVLRRPSLARPLGQLLARLTVAIGYLPSWRSPSLELRATPAGAGDDLPQLTIRRNDVAWGRDPMLRAILWRLTRAGRRLDLWPILPGLMVAIGAKSYHVGSTFPHSDRGRGWPSSDRLGRVGPWDRIHLVDAAVFPNVPATTFTLTVMANAHRIATETAAATLATAADDR